MEKFCDNEIKVYSRTTPRLIDFIVLVTILVLGIFILANGVSFYYGMAFIVVAISGFIIPLIRAIRNPVRFSFNEKGLNLRGEFIEWKGVEAVSKLSLSCALRFKINGNYVEKLKNKYSFMDRWMFVNDDVRISLNCTNYENKLDELFVNISKYLEFEHENQDI